MQGSCHSILRDKAAEMGALIYERGEQFFEAVELLFKLRQDFVDSELECDLEESHGRLSEIESHYLQAIKLYHLCGDLRDSYLGQELDALVGIKATEVNSVTLEKIQQNNLARRLSAEVQRKALMIAKLGVASYRNGDS